MWGVSCNNTVSISIPNFIKSVSRCQKDYVLFAMTESEFSRFEFYCKECLLCATFDFLIRIPIWECVAHLQSYRFGCPYLYVGAEMFVVSGDYYFCNIANRFDVTFNVSPTVCIPSLCSSVFRCYKDSVLVGMTKSELSRFEFYCP